MTLVPNVLSQASQIIAAGGVPMGPANTGSIGNNGALTLGTALALTYSGGIYLYFPAGALFTGSAAGFYFTIMSSTTLGTVYANTYTSGVPLVPPIPVPIVATGPGAYTGVTATPVGINITIPANIVGQYGMLRVTALWTYINNADNKLLQVQLGGVSLYTANGTTQASAASIVTVYPRGSLTSAVTPALASPGNNTSNTPAQQIAVNFGVAQALTVTASIASATDYNVLEAFLVEAVGSTLVVNSQ